MYENLTNMDKATKSFEWVKLIDLELFTKHGQSMIKVNSKWSIYKNGVWKIMDLRSKFLIWKEVRMFAQHLFHVFKSMCEKVGHNGMNG